MNRYMEEKWPWIEGTHALRNGLLDAVNDADFTFNPGGTNLTLGELCRELGEIEYSYIQSLKTFTQDWTYRNTTEGLDTSVSQLKDWYNRLDEEFKETVSAFSDEDFKKTIERGFPMPVEMQLDVYLQALLIFLGKGTIYLRAMNKTVPQKIQEWIG